MARRRKNTGLNIGKAERYAGIDASLTGCSVCVVDGSAEIESLTTLKPPDELDRISRLIWIRDSVLELCSNVDVVAIEHYAFARINQAHQMGELGGLLRVGMYKVVPFFEVPPASLKKYVTGKGNSNKNVVLERCYRKFGVGSETLLDDNQVDAFCLAMLVRNFLGWKRGWAKFTKSEIEVFEKIGEPIG